MALSPPVARRVGVCRPVVTRQVQALSCALSTSREAVHRDGVLARQFVDDLGDAGHRADRLQSRLAAHTSFHRDGPSPAASYCRLPVKAMLSGSYLLSTRLGRSHDALVPVMPSLTTTSSMP